MRGPVPGCAGQRRDDRRGHARHLHRRLAGGLTTLVLLVAACTGGSPDPDVSATGASPDAVAQVTPGTATLDGARIVVSSKDHDEQVILGHLSLVALEEAGADADDRVDLGGTEAVRTALLNGVVDHYWEYTGTGWLNHLEQLEPAPDRLELHAAVRAADLAQNDVVWLEPTPFTNSYGIAVSREAAAALGDPRTLSDLARIIVEQPREATLCVERQFGSRAAGLPAMEARYGYEFPDGNVSTLDSGLLYPAIAAREPCNFGEVFTTDGSIAEHDLTVLDDDRSFFPLYNASPVFTRAIYERYGRALEECFGPITRALTQDAMIALHRRVAFDGERPRDVARSFLQDNDLLDGCAHG